MKDSARNASLGKRYIFKLASNAATLPLFLVMEAILPRALGPDDYGSYSFATMLFYNFISFLDMGTSTCLSTSMAKRPTEFGLAAFYFRVALAVLFLCGLSVGAMAIPLIGNTLMPDIPLWFALPSAIWAYLTWLGRVTRSANDALGITTTSEIVRMAVNLTSAVVLIILFFAHWLNIGVLFLHQYITIGSLSIGFCYTLRGEWEQKSWSLSRSQCKEYCAEFWKFSGPLFIMTLCSSFALSGERWLLQFFNGSVQQGYFSLSQKVSMGCFLFVTAMTPLIMRELAVAHGKNNPQLMGKLLDRYAPMLYAVAAWFACFTSIEAEAVVRIFGGAAFADALLPVQIMTLFAIHQGYGQLAGSVFYATNQTKPLRNLTIAGLVIGIVCAYVFLAPHDMGGLSLGATGLALKMVIVQVLAVNILLIACKKFAPFRLRRNLVHQIICPVCLLALALVTRQATELAGLGAGDNLIRFFISGVFYTILTTGLAWCIPFVIGLEQGDLAKLCQKLYAKFIGKKIIPQ